MINAQQLQQMLEIAKQNPDTEDATLFRQRLESGVYDAQLRQLGKRTFGTTEATPVAMTTPVLESGGSPFLNALKNQLVGAVRDIPEDFRQVGEDVVGGFQRRTSRIGTDIARRAEDGFTPTEVAGTALGIGGATLATLTDSVFQGLIGLAKVPLTQEQEDAIAGVAEKTGEFVGSQQAVQNIVKGWNEFEQGNPEAASNLRAAGDFAQVLADITGLKFGTPIAKATVETASEVIKNTAKVGTEVTGEVAKATGRIGIGATELATEGAQRLITDVSVKAAQARRQTVQDLIAPGLNKAETQKIIDEERLTRTKGSFFFGKKPDIVDVSDRIKEVSDTITRRITDAHKMDDVGLAIALRKEIETISDTIRPKMAETSLGQKTKEAIQSAWDNLKKEQARDPDFEGFTGSKRFQSNFEAFLKQVDEAETLEDLWDIRAKYDQSIKPSVKKAIDVPGVAPSTLIQKEMWLDNRRILNDALKEAADGLGEEVKQAFLDMSHMYTARTNIINKAKIDVKGKKSLPRRLFKGSGREVLPFIFGGIIF